MIKIVLFFLISTAFLKANYLEYYSNSIIDNELSGFSYVDSLQSIRSSIDFQGNYGMDFLKINKVGLNIYNNINKIKFQYRLFGASSQQNDIELRIGDTPKPLGFFGASNELFGLGMKLNYSKYMFDFEALHYTYDVIDYSESDNRINAIAAYKTFFKSFSIDAGAGLYNFWINEKSYIGFLNLNYSLKNIDVLFNSNIYYNENETINEKLGFRFYDLLTVYGLKSINDRMDLNYEFGVLLDYNRVILDYEIKIYKKLKPLHSMKILVRII